MSKYLFSSVISKPLTTDYHILDLTKASSLTPPPLGSPYLIGRFNEVRSALYSQALFSGDSPTHRRCVHMGIDLGAPAGAEVFTFDEGIVYAQGVLSAEGDYGHTIVIQYVWSSEDALACGSHPIERGTPYWALYGHLSHASIQHLKQGERVQRGQVIGWLGSSHENGGWPPHLHFQLSRLAPLDHDLPGAVTLQDREQALNLYPDPRGVLGPLY